MKMLRLFLISFFLLIGLHAHAQDDVRYLPTELNELLPLVKDTSNPLYTSALFELAEIYAQKGDLKSSCKYLLLLSGCEKAPTVSVLTNKAFRPLHSNRDWKKIEANISHRLRTKYPKLNMDLAVAFSNIFEEDQKYRNGDYADELVAESNKRHIAFLDSVTTNYGFPVEALISDEGVDGVFVTIQHSQLPELKKFFKLWTQVAVTKKEKRSLAYIEDRILQYEMGKQKYGTQFLINSSTGKLEMIPLLDSTNVDSYREKIGLIPLKKYLELIGNK